MNLLTLFGCTPNNRGEYIFIDANTPEEIELREIAANEFRQFYDEIKKVKNGSSIIMEYFLNVSFLLKKKSMKSIFSIRFYRFQHPTNDSIHMSSF